MRVGNFSALAPTTEDLQRRYMEYILWWYVITSPLHLRQRRYIGNMEYVLCRYVITLPLHLRQCIYRGDIWSTYYGGT